MLGIEIALIIPSIVHMGAGYRQCSDTIEKGLELEAHAT